MPLSCWTMVVPPRRPASRSVLRLGPNRVRVDCLRLSPGPPRLSPETTPGKPVVCPWTPGSASRLPRRRTRAACPGGTPGSEASGQLESFTQTVPVRRLTCSIWPWIPRQSSTSPCSPGRNQNWLRYHPPGKDASAGDSRKLRPALGVDGPGAAQPPGGYDGARTAVARPGTTPPSSSICPNRSRSRAVAARPPSCTAVPSPSQMISASRSAPIGAQTRVEIRSAIRAPPARSQTQPSTSVSAER